MPKDNYYSPLRYPGGKGILSNFFKDLISANNITGTYCEAYAGGAGAALELLFTNKVARIILNDADYHIYAFWYSILNNAEEFVQAIRYNRISITGWKRQREIYDRPMDYSLLEVGFATFFLNRCNRGGILPDAGPIGGFNQAGNYSIKSRYNKENLILRIKKIASKRNDIEIHNLDAIDFLREIVAELDPIQTLVYLDPPYFQQGKNLYLNFYNESDHRLIEVFLRDFEPFKWIVSYDNVLEINLIYSDYRKFPFNLNYSVQVSRRGKELMIFSENLELPKNFAMRNYSRRLICA